MKALANKIDYKMRERLHTRVARGVLETPSVEPRDDGLVLFSMIGTRVLFPYLVAIKSLHHFLQRGRIVILDDGSLTDADKALLRDHLGRPQILSAAKVDTRGCPTYSSWRRLFALLDLRRENYVIQLDSDTVTIDDVPLVAEYVDRKVSFILRGEDGAEFSDLNSIAERARRFLRSSGGNAHVQSAMEAAMDQVTIPGYDSLRYVRGCAGFAGFAPNPDGSALAEQFSHEAKRLLGFDHWSQWGSEQVTSNFLISNEPGSQLLPYDRYCNFWNEPLGDDMQFVHFIGTYRYHRGIYSDLTRRMIDRLRADHLQTAAE